MFNISPYLKITNINWEMKKLKFELKFTFI